MAVPVTTEAQRFPPACRTRCFDVQVPEQTAPFPTDYTVTADGQRFLLSAPLSISRHVRR